jgi:4-hydroxy-4-methyl-2-oxoglutarate aldolase
MATGPCLPAQHAGSVDVFLEALQGAAPGQVLVIGNEGRVDEGCIGDLTALEAMHHGATAIVVDGAHRDTAALRTVGLPVWSHGGFPFGPRVLRPRGPDALRECVVAGHRVTGQDFVALDDDGAVFLPAADVPRVWELAGRIQSAEAEQARRAQSGDPLCQQFQVEAYLKSMPRATFREHLRRIGKAIEE